MEKKLFKKIWNRVYSGRSELCLSDEIIIIKNFILVESYDEKTAKNYRNHYVAEIWLLIETWFAYLTRD